jgi:hypothetical protein
MPKKELIEEFITFTAPRSSAQSPISQEDAETAVILCGKPIQGIYENRL